MKAVVYGLCLFIMGTSFGSVLLGVAVKGRVSRLDAVALASNLMVSGLELYLLYRLCLR